MLVALPESEKRMPLHVVTCWAMVAAAALLTGAGAAPADKLPPAADASRRVVRDGVAIDFTIQRLGQAAPLMEGDLAEVRFRMTDTASGRPVPGLKPAAWMDMAGVVGGKPGQDRECKDKVALYLQGSVGIRPMIDLNSYYLLLMNRDSSISVIDPVVSMTGNTSLLASVVLKRPAGDWARSRDGRRLYASMPRAGEVAVIDSETFRLVESVPAGAEPMRLALQPDGRYLWVANDAREAERSGVTVIDTESRKTVARVATGRGHHEIAFSEDGRLAFVSNREEGTVSAIEVATFRKVKDLRTGPLPLAMASSPLSQSIYVADGKAGTVAVIEPGRLEVVARIGLKPGLGPMRFSQDGRWGFVVNPAERAVHVIDAAENRLVHTIPVDGKPYQVSLTRAFAYVRMLDSPQVKMVNLQSLGAGKTPIVQGFGAGTGAPSEAGDLSIADSVTQASTDAAVFVSNPVDSTTYFYMEGMNAPMGSYGGYGHRVAAATVVDRSLKEVEPGVYAGKVKIPIAGRYDVAFLLDNPRVLHCFSADALTNPALRKELGELAVEFVDFPAKAATGTKVPVRVKLSDPTSKAPRDGVAGVKVLYHSVPGGPKVEAEAAGKGNGIYEAVATVDRAGAWYFFISIPSLKVMPKDVPYRGLVVEAPKEKTP
jgi:DNA-binding beta-propeller fold protein YncE